MEKSTPYKSPRKLREEANAYLQERFETYMQAEDRGEISRELAIAALRDEVDGNPCFTILRGDQPDGSNQATSQA